jgi:transposase
MLRPIRHASQDVQADLALLYARHSLVGARAKLINTARGLVKAYGARLPDCDAPSFARKVRGAVPLALRAAIEPLLRSVEQLSEEIHSLAGRVEALADRKYAQTAAMRQITGVGALTSVAFALVLRDPYRFRRSNEYLRQLLVGSAHYILGPFGPECDLRRWGLHKAQGGKWPRSVPWWRWRASSRCSCTVCG